MISTIVRNSDIHVLYWSLVENMVSCWTTQGGRVDESREVVAVKRGKFTPPVDEIDSWVAWIVILSLVYFQHYDLIISNWQLGIVRSQAHHLLEPY